MEMDKMGKYFGKFKKYNSRINIHNGGRTRAEMTWKSLVYEMEDKPESFLDYREKPKEIKIKRENDLHKIGVRDPS